MKSSSNSINKAKKKLFEAQNRFKKWTIAHWKRAVICAYRDWATNGPKNI